MQLDKDTARRSALKQGGSLIKGEPTFPQRASVRLRDAPMRMKTGAKRCCMLGSEATRCFEVEPTPVTECS